MRWHKMYCTHCAKHIDETKIEAKSSSYKLVEGKEIAEGTTISYICPRCGHEIHHGVNDEEVKSLSRAAHAQVQRARNYFASGMGSVSLGAILGIIAALFFALAHKPSNGYELTPGSAEFLVSVVLFVITVILLAVGGVLVVRGILTKKANSSLLRDINNGTFVQ